jgi:hypothetical protein
MSMSRPARRRPSRRTPSSRFGFLWGPSDGNFGAIPAKDGTYTFFGAAGAMPCSRDGACERELTFSSTLDHVTGGKAGMTDIDRIGA